MAFARPQGVVVPGIGRAALGLRPRTRNGSGSGVGSRPGCGV